MIRNRTKEWVELRFGCSIEELLREGRELGLSLREIGADLGVSCWTVHNWVHEHEIPPATPRPTRQRARLLPRQAKKSKVRG